MDLPCPQHALDIGPDGAGRIQDGRVRERSRVDADPLGEAVTQVVIGQQGRSTVGVMNDRHLEPGARRRLGLYQVADVGDVADDGPGYPAADVPLDERLAQLDLESLRRIDPAVEAGDDVQVQPREERNGMFWRASVRANASLRSKSGARLDIAGLPSLTGANWRTWPRLRMGMASVPGRCTRRWPRVPVGQPMEELLTTSVTGAGKKSASASAICARTGAPEMTMPTMVKEV